MTEEELRERLDRLEEIHRRRRDDILFPNEKELHEIRAAILTAFAELRQERDAILDAFNSTSQIISHLNDALDTVLAERDLLREAVESLGWYIDIHDRRYCRWCYKENSHAQDCLRQRALSAGKEAAR